MELFTNFISDYGTTILYTIITAIAGYLGVVFKSLYLKYINDQTKKDVVSTCVKAVEQLYKDLHGSDKLAKACESAALMFAEKGVKISDLELRMLIEASLAEFNEAFKKTEAEYDLPSGAEVSE